MKQPRLHGYGHQRQGENTLNLSFGFGIDLADIGSKAARISASVFPTSGKNNISRVKPRRKGALHLTMGDNIRTSTKPGQQPQHSKVGI